MNSFSIKPTFVNMGFDCQCAHQIRRVTGMDTAFMFDWLVTPIESCGLLLGDDADWFRPGNWEIVCEGYRVYDKGTRLEFQHEFPVLDPDEPRVDVSKVEGHLDAARSKYLYLKRRTLNFLAAAKDLHIIRREYWADAAVAEANASAIIDAYGRINPGLKVVIVTETDTPEAMSDRHLFLRIEGHYEWTGNDRSWDRVFALAGAWADSRAGA